MHPIEIDKALKTFSVIVDTREQKWGHIETSFKADSVLYKTAKLNYGDYTCQYTNSQFQTFSLDNTVVIERNASIDELVGNFTKGRQRFDREFQRAIADKAKVFLLIEDSRLWEHIRKHEYRSKMPP